MKNGIHDIFTQTLFPKQSQPIRSRYIQEKTNRNNFFRASTQWRNKLVVNE